MALWVTRLFLSLLGADDAPAVVWCFLFLEAAIAAYVWLQFVCDLLGVTQDDSRLRHWESAVATLIMLLVTYALLLPASA